VVLLFTVVVMVTGSNVITNVGGASCVVVPPVVEVPPVVVPPVVEVPPVVVLLLDEELPLLLDEELPLLLDEELPPPVVTAWTT